MHVAKNIWCAGAVCSFQDEIIGQRRRLNQIQHAEISGRVAGANMTNANKKYTYQSCFLSTLYGNNSISGVGEINTNLNTVIVLQNDHNSKFTTKVF